MQTLQRSSIAGVLLRALEVLAWIAFFAFAATFLALRFWLLPHVGNYRAEAEAALTRVVGLQVKIGALQAEWDGLRPRLVVSDLRILDREGREALRLPTVEPVLDWSTLVARELRLYSLAIEGPRLTVRRDASGAIHVAGLKLGAAQVAQAGEAGLAGLLLGQREIVIRNAEIEWVDELRAAPPLPCTLQFRLRNRGDVHQIGLSARPPRELGASVELRASVNGDVAMRPETWTGRVYAELGYTDLAGWRAWFDYPVEVSAGQGALRVWASFGAGKLVDAAADLALTGVVARLGRDLPVLQIASVSGRVEGRQTAHGYEFGARRLALVPAQGAPLAGTTFHASWEAAHGAQVARGAVSADLIELGPLAQLAEYLPFPRDLRACWGLTPRACATWISAGAASCPTRRASRSARASTPSPWLPGGRFPASPTCRAACRPVRRAAKCISPHAMPRSTCRRSSPSRASACRRWRGRCVGSAHPRRASPCA
jgi:uncharacterized protein YhdP